MFLKYAYKDPHKFPVSWNSVLGCNLLLNQCTETEKQEGETWGFQTKAATTANSAVFTGALRAAPLNKHTLYFFFEGLGSGWAHKSQCSFKTGIQLFGETNNQLCSSLLGDINNQHTSSSSQVTPILAFVCQKKKKKMGNCLELPSN